MGRPLIFVNTDNFPKFCDNRCLNTNCSKHLSRLAGHSGGAKISKLRGTPDCEGYISKWKKSHEEIQDVYKRQVLVRMDLSGAGQRKNRAVIYV